MQTQVDIIELSKIIGAFSVILGAIIGAYKLYDKLIDRVAKLEERVAALEKENRQIKKENSIVIKGLQACLGGLIQLNCNGEVTTTKKEIDDYINNAAHDQN